MKTKKDAAGVRLHTLLLLWLHLGLNERNIWIRAQAFLLFRMASVSDPRMQASVLFNTFLREPLFCILLFYWKPKQWRKGEKKKKSKSLDERVL